MIYLLFVFVALISVCLIEIFAARMGVIDFGKKLKLYKACDDEVSPLKGKNLVLITIICFAITLAVQISLYINVANINFIKLYGLLLIILCAGIVDYKRRIIPNVLIVFGLIFRAIIYIYEIIFSSIEIKNIAINDLIGFAIGFVFLALISIITKGSLGFGDVKLFGIIGITTGAVCTYSTLLASLLVSLLFSVINLATKKLYRKDSFPFGPCISVGYFLVVMLTVY